MSNRMIPLVFAFASSFALAGPVHADDAADYTKRILAAQAALRQNDYRTAEAALVEALKVAPQTKRQGVAKLLDEVRKKETGAGVPSTKPALAGADRLALAEIANDLDDAGKAVDPEPRKAALEKLLAATGSYLAGHPSDERVWAIRATAALQLNRPVEGGEAADKLEKLGVADHGDDATLRLLVRIKQNGWIAQLASGGAAEVPAQATRAEDLAALAAAASKAQGEHCAQRIAQLEKDITGISTDGAFVNPRDGNGKGKYAVTDIRISNKTLFFKSVYWYTSVMDVNATAADLDRASFPAAPSSTCSQSLPIAEVKSATTQSAWSLDESARGKGLEFYYVQIVTSGKSCDYNFQSKAVNQHELMAGCSFDVRNGDAAKRIAAELDELSKLYREDQ